jgi:hypothetical protein
MKAHEVIITARNRICAPSTAASLMSLPCSRWSLANSTIRIPFFAAFLDLGSFVEKPLFEKASDTRDERYPVHRLDTADKLIRFSNLFPFRPHYTDRRWCCGGWLRHRFIGVQGKQEGCRRGPTLRSL